MTPQAPLAIIGIIVLTSGSVLWGIILLIVACLVGPGGYSTFQWRTRTVEAAHAFGVSFTRQGLSWCADASTRGSPLLGD